MRATFVFVALAIVANAADARVLKDEALAFVNALATKYDCHNEEANLVDTLGTILIKNEDRQKASSQKCADDRASAGKTKDTAIARATKIHTDAIERANKNLATRLKEADAKYDQTEQEHMKLVQDAKDALDKAKAVLAMKKGKFEEATTTWALARETYDVGMQAAKTLKAQTIHDATANKDQAIQDANDSHSAMVNEATKAHTAHNAQCERSFAETKDMLDKDEATINQVDGLVQKLHMCEQGKAGKKETATVPEALIESKSRTLRGEFGGEETVLLETSAQACMSMRTQLQQLAPAAAVTGDVADMRKRLQTEREKNAQKKTACLDKSLKLFTNAKTTAADKLTAETAAAETKLATDTAEAEKKYDQEAARLGSDKAAAKKVYEGHKKAYEDALDDKNEKQAHYEAKLKGQETAMAAATELRDKEKAQARATHATRVEQAGRAKADAISEATQQHLEAIGDIDARCKTEAEELQAERDTVTKIQASLAKLTRVQNDCGARTGAKAGSAVWCRCNANKNLIANQENCENKGGQPGFIRFELCSWNAETKVCAPKTATVTRS